MMERDVVSENEAGVPGEAAALSFRDKTEDKKRNQNIDKFMIDELERWRIYESTSLGCENDEGKRSIVFVGDVGCGKTSLINFLSETRASWKERGGLGGRSKRELLTQKKGGASTKFPSQHPFHANRLPWFVGRKVKDFFLVDTPGIGERGNQDEGLDAVNGANVLSFILQQKLSPVLCFCIRFSEKIADGYEKLPSGEVTAHQEVLTNFQRVWDVFCLYAKPFSLDRFPQFCFVVCQHKLEPRRLTLREYLLHSQAFKCAFLDWFIWKLNDSVKFDTFMRLVGDFSIFLSRYSNLLQVFDIDASFGGWYVATRSLSRRVEESVIAEDGDDFPQFFSIDLEGKNSQQSLFQQHPVSRPFSSLMQLKQVRAFVDFALSRDPPPFSRIYQIPVASNRKKAIEKEIQKLCNANGSSLPFKRILALGKWWTSIRDHDRRINTALRDNGNILGHAIVEVECGSRTVTVLPRIELDVSTNHTTITITKRDRHLVSIEGVICVDEELLIPLRGRTDCRLSLRNKGPISRRVAVQVTAYQAISDPKFMGAREELNEQMTRCMNASRQVLHNGYARQALMLAYYRYRRSLDPLEERDLDQLLTQILY